MSGGLRVCRYSRPRATSNATWAPRFSHLQRTRAEEVTPPRIIGLPVGDALHYKSTSCLPSGPQPPSPAKLAPSLLPPSSHQPRCPLFPTPPRSTPHAVRPAPQRVVQVPAMTQLRNQADAAGAETGPMQAHNVGVAEATQ